MSAWAPPGFVDCGGHFARACALCPESNGDVWCNGECEWIPNVFGPGGTCMHETLVPFFPWLPGLPSSFNPIWWSSSFLAGAFIMLVFATVYSKQVIENMPHVPETNLITGKQLNLLACFLDRDTCLYTTFCLPVVLGKNYEAADVLGFWPGCIFSFLFHYSPFCCIGVIVRTILAKQVVDKLGQEQSLLMTFLMNTCCLPCAVGKESMEVDAETGATITCCCQIDVPPTAFAPVVTEVRNVQSRMCDDSFGKNRLCGN